MRGLWGIQGVLDLPHTAAEEAEAQTGYSLHQMLDKQLQVCAQEMRDFGGA